MPRVARDFPEAVGPVVPAPGEDLHRCVSEVDRHAVAIELDLVDPALAARHFVDGCGERRFNEPRERRFDAGLALAGHRSTKTHWQRQLHIAVPALVPVYEVLQEKGHVALLDITAAAHFLRHVR